MATVQEWLDDKVRGSSPDGGESRVRGDLAAVEQLARAWRGLDGQGSSVFGMASAPSSADVDVERVKADISAALESWLERLEVGQAAEVLSRCERVGMQLRAPDAVREAMTRQSPARAPAEVEGASQDEVVAMEERIDALPELVSKARWDALVARWRKLAELVDGTDGFDVHQPLSIKAPMSSGELATIQARLDRSIPAELLYVAAHFSAGVQLGWAHDLSAAAGSEVGFPANRLIEGRGGAPEESAGLFDLEELPELLGCRDWELDGETTEWSTVLPLFQYESDYVAIDTADDGEQPVVYMSHEEGCRSPALGTSFMDFLERWAALRLVDLETYCVGSPCLETQGFSEDEPALREWRSWWSKLGSDA